MNFIMNIRKKYHQIKQKIRLWLDPSLKLKPTDPPFELHFSKKQKYVSCVISKNGCSSILASILKYDFEEQFEIKENEKIWRRADLWKPNLSDFRLFIYENTDTTSFSDYKVFLVLRDPFDRFVSFINNSYKEAEYNYLFDKSLTPQKYVDSVLKMFPHMIDYTRKDKRYDKHAISQRVYFEKYCQIFGDRLEVVMIDNLPEYYEQLSGHPLLKNNVTGAKEKVCTRDSLTDKQKTLIEKYIRKYEFYKDDKYTQLLKQNLP